MIRLLLIALLLSAQGLAAQTVSVRSGEHPGFTRLVLTQPAPSAWEFGRSETGYVVRMRGNIKEFDTAKVFERIGRGRLSGLAARPMEGLLALDIGCVCHAIATPFRPGVIVIDIAEGPAPAGSPYEELLLLPGQPESWTRPAPQLRPPRRPVAVVGVPPKATSLGPRRLLGRPELPPFARRLKVPDIRAGLLGERLSRELSRGIASGAITAAMPPPATMPARARVVAPIPSPSPPPASGPQIQTRPPGAPPSREPPASGVACIAGDQLDLAAWGDDRPAWLQIAEKRLPLLSEFDRPDPTAILALARLYLHLGFGAEARSLLESWPLQMPETPLLLALGAVIDGGEDQPVFRQMQSCDGPAALWSVLEQPRLPAATDRAAVLRGFSDLPSWQRRELGPRLAQRFIAAGDLATAQSLEQRMSRALPPQSPEAALVGGQLDLARGQSAAATPQLESVARSNSPLAPTALAALLDDKLARGEQITEAELTALEALAQLQQGSPEATALRRTLARSLIAAGAVERAFATIAPRTPELYPDLWELLAQRGSDADLAREALAPLPASLRDLPDATRQKLANRLIAAGFPTRALGLLEVLPGAEADLSRARAHLTLRDGRAALRSLAGAEGLAAATIRAEALELLDDLEGAELAWQEAGNAPRAARLRLLRQEWASLPPSAPAELRLLVNGLAQEPELPPEPLARARAQIAAARELRAAALGLIQTADKR